MGKLLNWLKQLDNNLVKILLIGFVFFVPLWPKLPFKMIDYTYVAIRFEDIYLAILPLIFFLSAVFISFFWNSYISKTIIFPHLGFLHSARRVEYLIMFFIASS